MTVQDKELELIRKQGVVSIFWITEIMARAKRIDEMVKAGVLVRHRDDPRDAYPWCVFTVHEDKL